jgi:hypothetical protein
VELFKKAPNDRGLRKTKEGRKMSQQRSNSDRTDMRSLDYYLIVCGVIKIYRT